MLCEVAPRADLVAAVEEVSYRRITLALYHLITSSPHDRIAVSPGQCGTVSPGAVLERLYRQFSHVPSAVQCCSAATANVLTGLPRYGAGAQLPPIF